VSQVSRLKHVILHILSKDALAQQNSHVRLSLFCAYSGIAATTSFRRKIARMHQHRDAIKVSLLTALSDTNVGLVFTVVNSELRPGIDLYSERVGQ
jgi:hypothetical protein